MSLSCDAKIALVTGAGSGIGRATALALAREGAAVVIGDIDAYSGQETARLVTTAGGRALFVEVDVAIPGQVHDLGKIRDQLAAEATPTTPATTVAAGPTTAATTTTTTIKG